MGEEKEFSGMSPMPLEEKTAILNRDHLPFVHKVGLITSIVHVVIIFLPVIWVTLVIGHFLPWNVAIEAFIGGASVMAPMWFIEPITYFSILGSVGTYVSFLAGNISNMRLPVGAVALEVADVRPGSPEAELVGGLAVIISQWVLTAMTFLGALVCTAVVAVLPPGIKSAFDYLLPAIFGAIFGQFSPKAPRYAIIALLISIPLTYFKLVPAWAVVPIMVFGMASLVIILYRRGIWVK